MKKVLFGFSLIIILMALISLINVAMISDQGITTYGYGYIVGLVILFFVGIITAYATGKRIFRSE